MKQTKKNNINTNSSNKFFVYGKHPFFSVLKSGKRQIFDIYVAEKNRKEFFDIIKKDNIKVQNEKIQFVKNEIIDNIFQNLEKNHQGYLINVNKKDNLSFDDFIINIKNSNILPNLLILDQILDPHNLGAIIRTAVAFNIENIIITAYNSVKDTPIVMKTSAGLSEIVNLIEVINLNNTIKDLKNAGYFIVGLDGEAKLLINQITDNKNLALVLGNEGKGIRELVKKNCDELVKIQMKNDVESLNVSVASAIAIYEIWGKYA